MSKKKPQTGSPQIKTQTNSKEPMEAQIDGEPQGPPPLDQEVESQVENSENSQQQIAQLETEKQELKEALLRKQADFENYRRRMQKDKEEAIKFANRSLISEFLEVLDNFERARLSHQPEKDSSTATKTLFEGMELVEKQFTEMLCNRGLKAIDSVGHEFNPNLHEALQMEEISDYKVPTVVENFQTGYTLHERVLRPARVKVAQPAESQSENLKPKTSAKIK